MAAEYSYITPQTVAENENILFMNGSNACKKGFITHRNGAGLFRLKSGSCGGIYEVTFTANIAIATGGTVAPISVALQEDGETLGNAIATVTPAAVGDFVNVSISTLIPVTCGCCASVSIENVSTGNAIDVTNANIIFNRVG